MTSLVLRVAATPLLPTPVAPAPTRQSLAACCAHSSGAGSARQASCHGGRCRRRRALGFCRGAWFSLVLVASLLPRLFAIRGSAVASSGLRRTARAAGTSGGESDARGRWDGTRRRRRAGRNGCRGERLDRPPWTARGVAASRRGAWMTASIGGRRLGRRESGGERRAGRAGWRRGKRRERGAVGQASADPRRWRRRRASSATARSSLSLGGGAAESGRGEGGGEKQMNELLQAVDEEAGTQAVRDGGEGPRGRAPAAEEEEVGGGGQAAGAVCGESSGGKAGRRGKTSNRWDWLPGRSEVRSCSRMTGVDGREEAGSAVGDDVAGRRCLRRGHRRKRRESSAKGGPEHVDVLWCCGGARRRDCSWTDGEGGLDRRAAGAGWGGAGKALPALAAAAAEGAAAGSGSREAAGGTRGAAAAQSGAAALAG